MRLSARLILVTFEGTCKVPVGTYGINVGLLNPSSLIAISLENNMEYLVFLAIW
jgi:hypothetical protein